MKKIKIVLLIEASTSYGRGLIRGIIKYSKLVGPWLFYREPIVAIKDRFVLDDIQKWKPDGLIIRDSRENLELLTLGIPTAVSTRYEDSVEGQINIVGNSERIGKMAADYFLQKGYTQFAFCGFKDMGWSRERGLSFKKFVGDSTFFEYDHEESNYDGDQASLVEWLKSLPKPIALMACNDVRGRHVLEGCDIAGIEVPEKIAVMGVNNDDIICDLTAPPMSSISLGVEKAGYNAAKWLYESIIQGKMEERTIFVEPEIIEERQSTNILAIDDMDVAEAIKFIRENCKIPIQIDDVVDAVAIGRRRIERKFKKYLGHTIHQEIKNSRIAMISKFLLETDMSVTQIAMMMGFKDDHHISRYFSKAKKHSPRVFREKFQ